MTVHPEQFRLSRIQLINWGTVDGYLDIPVDRTGFLVTGASGSGKSTIIDAVAAVLVPPEKLSFNAAGQAGGTRGAGRHGSGRSLVSYIRGAWRRGEDPESGGITSTYLRPGATWSAVALTYTTGSGRGTDLPVEHITLTAFYYLRSGETSKASVKKLYGIHQDALDLDAGVLHPLMSTGINIRRVKATWPAPARFSESHRVFADRFRPKLGITSPEALLLLHRTQSAKQLDNLDQLFREYMLTEPDTFSLADDAVAQFTELRTAYERVQDVKARIGVLDPLPDLVTRRDTATADASRAAAMLGALPRVRDRLHRESLTDQLRELDASLAAASDVLSRAQDDERRADADLRSADTALAGAGGGQLQVLELQAERARDRLAGVRKDADALAAAVTALGGVAPTGAGEFTVVDGQARDLLASADGERERLETGRNDAVRRQGEADKELREVTEELAALAKSTSNIGHRHVRLREDLCRELGVKPRELPYAGELIDVIDDHRDWEPVAQRLLGGFATTLLVPARLIDRVSGYVHARHTGVRLVYRSVPERVSVPQRPANADALSLKLSVVDHPFHDWVLAQLRSRHEYRCVDSPTDFARLGDDRGVTRTGLVHGRRERDGSVRFEKDDRFRIEDRSRWMLGSTNHDKQELLAARRATLSARATAADRERRDGEVALSTLSASVRAAELITATGWSAVDTSRAADLVTAAEKAVVDWSDSPEHAALTAARDAATVRLRDAKAVLSSADRQVGVLRSRREDAAGHLAQLDERSTSTGPDIDPEILAAVEAEFTRRTRRVTVSTVLPLTEEISVELHAREADGKETVHHVNQRIQGVLSTYLERWPEEKSDLTADPEFAGEAVARLTGLRRDRLAEFTGRFLTLMNGTSVTNLTQLSRSLRRAKDLIAERIDSVNQSLSRSEFAAGRWLRIDVRDNRGSEVTDFQRDLQAAVENRLGAADTPEEAEDRYRRMSELLDRLGSEETNDRRWRRTVLDTRRHVRFIGVETDAEGTAVNAYVDSASLSGGQAQKLVFFCLAAALRFQLAEVDEEFPRYATVILDEAFDRADPEFTRTAMDVFTSFGFHMVLATPLKLIQTLQNYVGGVVVVGYTERADASGAVRASTSVAPVAMDELRASVAAETAVAETAVAETGGEAEHGAS
ncbi:ATP-binding protein [uncultured Corynebacterium sp.]|uniref:ATP-binding protein n=1 Tax=uncultured Corynebacterium sp. TaxID=159447 RepID=UPI0026008BA9|nr:SbcC/MukB-like Walker B domain-containing protein [uncultured Corynebacterium sp.]